MTTACYTSPSDQAMGYMDIAKDLGAFSQEELVLIGEAARLVMEAALTFPTERPHEWVNHTIATMGVVQPVTLNGLEKKAQHAGWLLELGVLISDEELAARTIDNNFVRPAVGMLRKC